MSYSSYLLKTAHKESQLKTSNLEAWVFICYEKNSEESSCQRKISHLESQRPQELREQRQPNSPRRPHPATPATPALHHQLQLLRLGGERERNVCDLVEGKQVGRINRHELKSLLAPSWHILILAFKNEAFSWVFKWDSFVSCF